MKKVKTVSVIVPVFQTEKYIKDCLDSLLQQSYEQLEIIVIENGSSETCTSIIKEFQQKDNRIQLYILDENKGPGYARNFGMQKATGNYLYFLDSDDYLPRETIELLVEHIKEYPLIKGKIRQAYLSNGITVVFPGHITPKMYKENRMRLLKARSALNCLIKRDFALKQNIAFSEESDLFNDMNFMIPALLESEVIPFVKEAIYFKRKRNDPILNPSLKQCGHQEYALNFFNMYHTYKNKYEQQEVQYELDKQLVSFYDKHLVKYFDGKIEIPKLFSELSEAMNRIDKSIISNYGVFAKREYKAIFRQNESAYQRIHNQHQFLRDLKDGFKTKRKWLKFLYKHIFRKLPRKDNLVFFESFLGKNYSDNPKYIYEYLDAHYPEYKTVWSFNEKTTIPGKAKQVQRFSLRYFYTLARAKYWVNNSRMPYYLQKRKEGVYLQTWHGTPLKRLVFDMDDVYLAGSQDYKANFYTQSRRWDYLNSANAFSTKIFQRAFQYDNPMLEYGYPRNDILYKRNNTDDIMNLKKKLGIPTDKKVVLYAPTWRDDDYVARGQYNFNLELDLKDMQKQLGEQYIIIVRTHSLVSEMLDLSAYEGFAFNFSNYDDIAELYLVSDIMITDYSSVFFDYANLKRPILFFTFDLEKYRDKLRGFYLDIENELPGPLLKTSDEVMNAIKNIEQVKEEYAVKYENFYKRFCSWENGTASEQTVKRVFLGEGEGQ